MFFGGGLIPFYNIMSRLGLVNTIWAIIIPSILSVWNLFMTKTFFASSIPESLIEAAKIDGAGHFKTFLIVVLPLAKPIIAVMALYYGVGHWNSYYSALLYLRKAKYYPLQLVLRNILISNELSTAAIENADAETVAYLVHRAEMVQVMKYAIIFIASAPLLIAYPFVQKHFTKGIMIGSVKG